MIPTKRPYYWREINLFRAFKDCGFEPKVIFDVGSSHSGWSRELSYFFPDAAFHLFEPLLDFKPYYQLCTDDALTKRPNLQVHKIALGDKDGWTQLGSDMPGYGASTLVTVPSKDFSEVFQVPIRRLDSYVAEFDLPKPDLLKVDVQGGEIAFLQGTGSLLDPVQLIQIETWLHRSYGEKTPLLHEIMDYLHPIGLRLVEFGDSYYDEFHQVRNIDAFFAKSELLEQCRERLPRTRLTDDRDRMGGPARYRGFSESDLAGG
jgi:FkbM family methyltransferase